MDHTTESAASTPPTEPRDLDREREAYRHASEVQHRIVDKLETLPRQAAVIGDLTGFRIRLNFGTNEPKGVLEFAQIADVPASRDENLHGVWMEARATIEGVPVCAEVLLSVEAAAVFDQHTPRPAPGPENTPEPAADADEVPPPVPEAVQRPVPLGVSVLAYVPAVTPVQPATGAEVEQ